MGRERWHDDAVRVMRWKQADGSNWTNQLGEVRLSDVVFVEIESGMPAGRWAVKLTLRTNPATAVIVDGNLDDWWYKNDLDLRERMEIEEDE